MKNKYLKRVMAMTAVATLCMTTAMPVMAETGGGVEPDPNGTEIRAGVMVEDELNADARIKVTVPTLFAFVVSGKVGDNTPLTSAPGADQTILLPNVQVANVQGVNYEVKTEGSSAMTFTNYSTALVGGNRAGIPLQLSGSIQNVGDVASRNGWTHTAAAAGVKEYNVSVAGQAFTKAAGNNALEMAASTILPAPDAGAGINAMTQLANVGSSSNLAFDVKVGGKRGDYATVEESAKVGTIVWSVSHAVTPTP